MPLRIAFELSDKDLKHFRGIMRRARSAAGEYDAKQITDAAQGVLESVKNTTVPEFIAQRLMKLDIMIKMVLDEGWAMPDTERKRVLSALAYFSDPEDLIPDEIPGLGFLDDAIMVELVVRELKHEIEAYGDFCKFRSAEVARRELDEDNLGRAGWLDDRRKQLHSRMRRRRTGERKPRSRSRATRGSSFSLW